MLASVSQAFCLPQRRACCPSIRFNESLDITLVKARGNLRPIGNQFTTSKETFPWGHKLDVDQVAVNDAALVGTMLAGSVSNCLQGVESKCAYLCDTDFVCNECIEISDKMAHTKRCIYAIQEAFIPLNETCAL